MSLIEFWESKTNLYSFHCYDRSSNLLNSANSSRNSSRRSSVVRVVSPCRSPQPKAPCNAEKRRGMFKKNKTVSLDVSLISPAIGGKKRSPNIFGSGQNMIEEETSNSLRRYGSQSRLRRISGNRSPMRLDLLSGSNADLRAG